MVEGFGKFEDLHLDDQAKDEMQVLQALLGTNEHETLSLVVSVGLAATQLLVEGSAQHDGETRIEIIVRAGLRRDSPVTGQVTQSLSTLVDMATRHRDQ